MKRRKFLKSIISSAAMMSVPLGSSHAMRKNKAKIQNYRRLGQTDIKMSDISFGCSTLPSSSIILRAIDRGINFFDTAPLYGRSEEILGEAVKRFGYFLHFDKKN